MTVTFILTRAAGLEAMQAFVPRMGARYAKGRNYDNGPVQHTKVSQLSSYIRRRLVTEAEVVMAAVQTHGADGA